MFYCYFGASAKARRLYFLSVCQKVLNGFVWRGGRVASAQRNSRLHFGGSSDHIEIQIRIIIQKLRKQLLFLNRVVKLWNMLPDEVYQLTVSVVLRDT